MIPEYHPVAEYKYGLYLYGAKEPYKTATVKADSQPDANEKARLELKPSTTESIKLLNAQPNLDHVKYRIRYLQNEIVNTRVCISWMYSTREESEYIAGYEKRISDLETTVAELVRYKNLREAE